MKHFVQRLFILATIYATAFSLSATLNFNVNGIKYKAESTSSTTATVVGFDNDENATYSIPEKVSYYGMSFDVNDIILSTSYTFYKLIIPKTISNIENFPTYDKNSYSCLRSLFVKSIEVDPENEHYGVIDNRFVYSKVNQDLLYYNEDDITTEITIPEEVKNIKSGAISSSILTKASILHKCSLEEDAFLWCSSLSTLEFDFTDEDLSNVDDKPKYSPAGIHKCGEAKQNNLLKTLIFGKNFYDNSILNSLLFNLYSIDNYIIDPANQYFSSEGRFLYNKDKTALLRVPATAFYESDYIIPEGIETIGDYAFYEGSYGCEYRYNSLVYPSTLKSLSSKQSLSSVNEINFEKCDKLYVIPSYAFAHTDIGAIKFPKNLKFIDTYAFYHQYPVAHRVLPDTLVLPESLDSIGFFAINCTQELVLPSNLKKIQQSNINSNVIVSKSITPPECEDYSIYVRIPL